MSKSHDEEFTSFAASALPQLRRTAFLVCGDWHRAEDAAQEALIRTYRSWRRVERREGLLAYARRTAVRVLVDESRRPWRRERTGGNADLDHQVADPAQAYVEQDAVLHALSSLSPRRRACVVLRYYHDLSVAETARALGCSEGTVKSQTSDALKALRPLVGEVVDHGSSR